MNQSTGIDWTSVAGLGTLRDEVVADRIATTPDEVRRARRRLGIRRRTGPIGWRDRVDVIASDAAAASAGDVAFLLEMLRELHLRVDADRKSGNAVRMRSELRAARCVIWALHSEECAEDLDGLPYRVFTDTVDTFSEAVESWWLRVADRDEMGLAWAERNAEHDPAPADFLAWVMSSGKLDAQSRSRSGKVTA